MATGAESSTEHLLDHVSRHAVEKQSEEDDEQEKADDFEDEPAVVVPEDVANWLEWIEKPNEGCVRSTTTRHQSHTLLDEIKYDNA